MKNKIKFPRFWFDGNLAWGLINNMDNFQRIVDCYKDELTRDELLDKSLNAIEHRQPRYSLKNKEVKDKNSIKSFGLRMEHRGNTTLRQFLTENGIKL
jgi:hypothetical protein